VLQVARIESYESESLTAAVIDCEWIVGVV